MEGFVGCIAEIIDPRQNDTRHDPHEMLMIAVVGPSTQLTP